MQGGADGYPTPNPKFINITSVIGTNGANVKIRFHYYNASFEWWWAIDNVKVRCALSSSHIGTIGLYNPAGGAFFLRNANSSAPADLVFTYGPAGAGWTPIVGD